MTKLEEIVAYKRVELAQIKRSRPVAYLERELKNRPPVRNFRQAIYRQGSLSLIAEVKRSSPSAGPIRPGADAVEIAKQYAQAGAHALSVLAGSKFFSGALRGLISVREKVALPVLRKDFLLEEYHVVEAAAAGSDCILLIVAILDRPTLKRLLQLASDLSVDVLVEVHTRREVNEALEVGADIVGINNRDLATLQVDLKTTQQLIRLIPAGRTVVSESGFHSRADVETVRALGAHAVLIGEEFMKADDIEKRVRELMG